MKAILLAGGIGSRLFPVTFGISKQLIPVYDKPMIYYPLSVLMLAGIREVLVISTPIDMSSYKRLLGDGSQWGIRLQYKIQEQPEGLAQAFILGEEFIGQDPVCLILGDNIFYGDKISQKLKDCIETINEKASVFGYHVEDPKRYGIIAFDSERNVISIEEKPTHPKSNYAVAGLYFYPNNVIEIAKKIKPSARGELEISDVNQIYLERGELNVKILERGYAWLDTGTHESLLEASQFIQAIEKRQGLKVGCLEEIAFEKGWITREQLQAQIETLKGSTYGDFLLKRYG
ncbi:MAG: glucose-1-phosphate thymidylyltransferase RfbA [Flavobacteriaceae bacterium]